LSFNNCEFEKDVVFAGKDDEKFNIRLNNSPGLEKDLDKIDDIDDAEINRTSTKKLSLTIADSKFKGTLSFFNNIVHDIFINEDQNPSDWNVLSFLNLDQAKFHKNVKLKNCQIKGFSSYNATFYQLVDMYKTMFDCQVQFHQTDFLQTAIFSKVKFNQEVQFLYNKVKPNTFISFENASFNSVFDISRANFYCNVNFWSLQKILSLKIVEILPVLDCDLYKYDK
jgi:hypothetical protein